MPIKDTVFVFRLSASPTEWWQPQQPDMDQSCPQVTTHRSKPHHFHNHCDNTEKDSMMMLVELSMMVTTITITNTYPLVNAQDTIHHNGFMMIKIEIIIVTRMTIDDNGLDTNTNWDDSDDDDDGGNAIVGLSS